MRGVSGQPRAVYFRCLATLFESGVPLVRCFELLAQQSEHPWLRHASQQVGRLLAQGNTPADAMQRYPACFSPLHIALVRVGQRSGAMSQVFLRLAWDEESQLRLRQKLRSSLIMPLFISAFCIALMVFVSPLLLGSVLQNLELPPEKMPWISQCLVAMGWGLRNPWCWLLGFTCAGLAWKGWRGWQSSDSGRLQLARQLDRIPGLGWLLRLAAATQFLQTLETTLSVGFPLLESLRMATEAANHPLLSEALPGFLADIKAGDELHEAARKTEFFNAMVIQGIQAGQESGSLTRMLKHLTAILQVDLDYACETFSLALEPLVMALVGGMVGACVIGTLLPMVRLVESL